MNFDAYVSDLPEDIGKKMVQSFVGGIALSLLGDFKAPVSSERLALGGAVAAIATLAESLARPLIREMISPQHSMVRRFTCWLTRHIAYLVTHNVLESRGVPVGKFLPPILPSKEVGYWVFQMLVDNSFNSEDPVSQNSSYAYVGI